MTALDRLALLGRHRQLVYCLVSRDLRVRYKRSVLGVLWAFAEPLVLMLLYSVVFSLLLRVQTPAYPAFALAGVVVWGFLHTGVTYSLSSITQNANLVKKIYFPREILPLAMVLGRAVHFLLSLFLLVPFLIAFDIRPTPYLLLLPLLVLIQLVLVLGLALLFSAVSTLYEDVGFLVNFAFSGLFYLSPVVYPVELVPARFQTLYLANPIAALITSYRAVIISGTPPPWTALGLAAFTSVLALALGLFVFRRVEWSFAEVL